MSTTTSEAIRPAAGINLPVMPDTAPFTPAQRAWLNGFLAGLAGAMDAPLADVGPQGQPQPTATTVVAPAAEDFPWHDAALSLTERMKLAEGRPRGQVLMAAMAQLDCGACGYLCKTYAEAIDRGEEKDFTKCAPGGAETAKKLKELVAQLPAAAPTTDAPSPPPAVAAKGKSPAAPVGPAAPAGAASPARPYGRGNPFPARLRQCVRLNGPASEKDTRHVVFDLKGSGLTYKPGDAVGVYPENCPSIVQRILELLDASGAEDVPAPDGSHLSLREALLRHYTITRPTARLAELLGLARKEPAPPPQGITAAAAAALAAVDACAADPMADGRQVLDLLTEWRAIRPRPVEFVECLSPLQPRLYSIASSPLAHPDEVHLTVGVVRFENAVGLPCKGVCSTYLSERVRPGQKVRVFVHPSSRFGLPLDNDVPIIMVGPGTGVAPFRAFLHHRKAAGAKGRSWLFFGDQRRAGDFLYRAELEQHLSDGTLTRLDTAFSRDGDSKVYVQHRMLEHAPDLWQWLQAGAHFYVCGDAKRMARDVDETLRMTLWEQGGMTKPDVDAYMANLTKTGRYQRDVY